MDLDDVFDEEKIDELANSIKENGLIQPIIVRKKDKKFEKSGKIVYNITNETYSY